MRREAPGETPGPDPHPHHQQENTMNDEQLTMTGAEFRCLREHLGLTNAWLAGYLGVAERSVARWGDDVMQPPPGVVEDMLELRDTATAAVDAGVARIAAEGLEQWPTWRTDDALHAAHPDDRYTAAWHRAIAARIHERVPATRITFADA